MNDEVKQIISAYILGCLDNKNLSQFVDYVHHGGKDIEGQLGEFQNIVSLIPTLLIAENPPDYIKDEVAQKILEIEFETRELKSKASEQKEPKEINLNHQPLYTDNLNTAPIPEPKAKAKKGFFLYSVFIFLILILAGWSVYSYFVNHELINRTKVLTSKAKSINEELKYYKNVNEENQILIEFLSKDNLRIVEFKGADSIKAKGKMFISFQSHEAVLTFNIDQELSSDEYLKLWAILKRNEVYCGEINLNPLKQFYKIDNLPAIVESNIKLFSITIEKRRAVDTQTKRVLMIGTFN